MYEKKPGDGAITARNTHKKPKSNRNALCTEVYNSHLTIVIIENIFPLHRGGQYKKKSSNQF